MLAADPVARRLSATRFLDARQLFSISERKLIFWLRVFMRCYLCCWKTYLYARGRVTSKISVTRNLYITHRSKCLFLSTNTWLSSSFPVGLATTSRKEKFAGLDSFDDEYLNGKRDFPRLFVAMKKSRPSAAGCQGLAGRLRATVARQLLRMKKEENARIMRYTRMNLFSEKVIHERKSCDIEFYCV